MTIFLLSYALIGIIVATAITTYGEDAIKKQSGCPFLLVWVLVFLMWPHEMGVHIGQRMK